MQSSRYLLPMTTALDHSTRIRANVLRDPRYPVSHIADRLLPYLQVLEEQFSPVQVVLFGSYAYGEPDEDSDIDLLIVLETIAGSIAAKKTILRAWRDLRWSGSSLPLELIVVSSHRHAERLRENGAFYRTINERGLALI